MGAIVVALLERTRRENNRDHARNAGKLDEVLAGQRRLERKADRTARALAAHTKTPHPPTTKKASRP